MDVLRRTGSSRLSPPRDALRIDTDQGHLALWEVAARIYAVEVRGHMSQAMSKLIIDRGELLYRRSPRTIYGFHNWLQMTGYESACRVDLTAWVLKHRPVTALHIGVTSRIVTMGVAVANLALGNLIRVHDSVAGLEAELAAALEETR